MPIDWNQTIKEAQKVEYTHVISVASQYVDAFNLYDVAIDPKLIRNLQQIHELVDNPVTPAVLATLWQVYDFIINCPAIASIQYCEQLLFEISTSQSTMDELISGVSTANKLAMFSHFANSLSIPPNLRRGVSYLTSSLVMMCSVKKRHSTEAYCRMYVAIMFAIIDGLRPSDSSQLLRFTRPPDDDVDE